MIIYDPVLHLLKADQASDLLAADLTDVLHNFTVPQFRVKMDFVPGQVSYIWAEPDGSRVVTTCSARSSVGWDTTRCGAA